MILISRRLLPSCCLKPTTPVRFLHPLLLHQAGFTVAYEADNGHMHPVTCRKVSSSVRPRTKELASVIREGIGLLNETATFIQDNPITKRPLFISDKLLRGPSERQKSEAHRIFQVANECLEDSVNRDPSLSVQGEPIVLLDIQVRPSIKVAILYWALPYSILMDDSITSQQKEVLQGRLQTAIEERGQAILQRRVSSVLHSYFPPKIRMEPAPQNMLMRALCEILDEDDF